MHRFALLIGLLSGCSQGPVFTNVQGVTIQMFTHQGLQKAELQQTGLRMASECLARTGEVSQEATEKRALMQTVYMIIVTDENGTRAFDLLTDRHLKGNKNTYYENTCIIDVVNQYGPK